MARGRPKTAHINKQEILLRKKLQAKPEAIDLCLNGEIISLTQHKSAIKFRHMYVTIYGVPTVQSYNFTKILGREAPKHSEEWLSEQYTKYRDIIKILNSENKSATRLICNVIIHNFYPRFLQNMLNKKMIEFKLSLEGKISCEEFDNNIIKIDAKILSEIELFKDGMKNLEIAFDEIENRYEGFINNIKYENPNEMVTRR